MIGHQKLEKPRVELGAGQDDLAVRGIQLRQGMEVLESPLPDQVVGVGDQCHQDVQRWLESDLVVVIDDQILEKSTGRAVEQPLEAAGVQVLELLSIIIDSAGVLGVSK